MEEVNAFTCFIDTLHSQALLTLFLILGIGWMRATGG